MRAAREGSCTMPNECEGDGEDSGSWACGACTLINPATSSECEACLGPRPMMAEGDSNRSPPSSAASSSTIIGGLIGGTAAYIRSNGSLSRAVRGAGSGAAIGSIAGRIIDELASEVNESSNGGDREDSDASSASSSASGDDGPPPQMMQMVMSMIEGLEGLDGSSIMGGFGMDSSGRFVPVGSFRGGSRSSEGGRGASRARSSFNPDRFDAAATEFMNLIYSGASSRDSFDSLSYEQLLEMFGNGSANNGATDESINAIPIEKISSAHAASSASGGEDDDDKDKEEGQCVICLETFKDGDSVKRLRCKHLFHADCIDKWLRISSCCPMCKASLE